MHLLSVTSWAELPEVCFGSTDTALHDLTCGISWVGSVLALALTLALTAKEMASSLATKASVASGTRPFESSPVLLGTTVLEVYCFPKLWAH